MPALLAFGRNRKSLDHRLISAQWVPTFQLPRFTMTLCPIAIAVGCKKCPIFAVCPVKGIIGDYKPGAGEDKKPQTRPTKSGGKKSR